MGCNGAEKVDFNKSALIVCRSVGVKQAIRCIPNKLLSTLNVFQFNRCWTDFGT